MEKIFKWGRMSGMREVSICVGSSCHLKGAYSVVNIFKEKVKEYNLEDQIHLKASFCQGDCTNGVVVTVDGKLFTGITPENAEQFFAQEFGEGVNNECS
jgi:NADH:ubiquinone oxidoreductase subunit E